MVSTAFGAIAGRGEGSATGKSLPVPDLQERELGANTRLITPMGADQPGEDALFAFAVSQGLDASLVASVLWPGPGGPGQGKDELALTDGKGGLVDPANAAEIISALLAGIATGQVTPTDGSRAGASLISGLGGAGEALTPVGATPGGWLSLAGAGGQAPDGALAIGVAGLPGGNGVAITGPVLPAAGLLAGTLAATPALPGAFAALNTSVMGAAMPGALPSAAGAAPANALSALTMLSSKATTDSASVPGSVKAGVATSILGAPISNTSPLSIAGAAASVGVESAMVSSAGLASGNAGVATGPALGSSGPAILPAQWVLLPARFQGAGSVGPGPQPAALTDAIESTASVDADPDSVSATSFGGAAERAGMTAQRLHGSEIQRQPFRADVLDLGADVRADLRGAEGANADKLSQRLAEGMAQRMAAQVANNSWKLNLELRPAHLGNVSVEMSMHNGRLEAVFDAGQATARALITEGLDRLKQELQKSGMNVAHLSLGFGSGASGGGKSTPGERGESGVEAAAGAGTQVAGAPVDRRRSDSEGLDVMV